MTVSSRPAAAERNCAMEEFVVLMVMLGSELSMSQPSTAPSAEVVKEGLRMMLVEREHAESRW